MYYDTPLALAMFLSRVSFLKPAEKHMLIQQGYTLSQLQNMDTRALSHALGRRVRSKCWKPDELIVQLSWHVRWLESGQGWACTYNDAHYPHSLAEIVDPPMVLYGRGDKTILQAPCVAIVGTRQPNTRGMHAAYDMGVLFANQGYNVVSGLAYGIDIAAHKGALEAQSKKNTHKCVQKFSDTTNIGKPIAVLGTGIDAIYPRSHIAYARDILSCKGAIISEMPPASKNLIHKHSFIGRNRIISGISENLVVVQCPKKSGAMATAEFALEQGRTVWIHSAGLDEGFEGTQYLYQCGAACIDDEHYAFCNNETLNDEV